MRPAAFRKMRCAMTGRPLPTIVILMRVAFLDHCGVDPYRYTLEKKIAFPVTRQSTDHVVAFGHSDSLLCMVTAGASFFVKPHRTRPRKAVAFSQSSGKGFL